MSIHTKIEEFKQEIIDIYEGMVIDLVDFTFCRENDGWYNHLDQMLYNLPNPMKNNHKQILAYLEISAKEIAEILTEEYE